MSIDYSRVACPNPLRTKHSGKETLYTGGAPLSGPARPPAGGFGCAECLKAQGLTSGGQIKTGT